MDLIFRAGRQASGKITHYLLEDIIQGDEAADIAILVHHQTDALLVTAELDKLDPQWGAAGNKVDLVHGAQQ